MIQGSGDRDQGTGYRGQGSGLFKNGIFLSGEFGIFELLCGFPRFGGDWHGARGWKIRGCGAGFAGILCLKRSRVSYGDGAARKW